eukprot:6113877-Prymnesium_polylepis.2
MEVDGDGDMGDVGRDERDGSDGGSPCAIAGARAAAHRSCPPWCAACAGFGSRCTHRSSHAPLPPALRPPLRSPSPPLARSAW